MRKSFFFSFKNTDLWISLWTAVPGAGLSQPAVLQHGGGGADVGRGTARCAQITLVKQLQQLLLSWTSHLCRQVTSFHNFIKQTIYFPCFVHSNNQTWFPLGFAVTLVDHVHGGAEVPHLNAPVCMASEEVPAGSGAHTARAFTLSHCKARDGGAIYSLHLTDPEIQV